MISLLKWDDYSSCKWGVFSLLEDCEVYFFIVLEKKGLLVWWNYQNLKGEGVYCTEQYFLGKMFAREKLITRTYSEAFSYILKNDMSTLVSLL